MVLVLAIGATVALAGCDRSDTPVLTFSGSWTELAEAGPGRARAELVAFEVPRGDAG